MKNSSLHQQIPTWAAAHVHLHVHGSLDRCMDMHGQASSGLCSVCMPACSLLIVVPSRLLTVRPLCCEVFCTLTVILKYDLITDLFILWPICNSSLSVHLLLSWPQLMHWWNLLPCAMESRYMLLTLPVPELVYICLSFPTISDLGLFLISSHWWLSSFHQLYHLITELFEYSDTSIIPGTCATPLSHASCLPIQAYLD